jgi:hypothetical protein
VSECETWSRTLGEEHRPRVVWKEGAEKNSWTQERRNKRRVEQITQWSVCSSPNIIRTIKSRGMGWTGRVGRMGREEYIQGSGG